MTRPPPLKDMYEVCTEICCVLPVEKKTLGPEAMECLSLFISLNVPISMSGEVVQVMLTSAELPNSITDKFTVLSDTAGVEEDVRRAQLRAGVTVEVTL